MDYQQGASAAATRLVRDKFGASQRRHYRYEIHSLSYVNINESNGGVIRNLNQSGLCVQSVAPLEKDQQIQLRFELLNPRIRVHAGARVRWVNAAGLAGMEFTNLSLRSSQLIKDWLLTQLLLRGQRLFVSSSIFVNRALSPQAQALDPSIGRTMIPDSNSPLSGLQEAGPDANRPAFWAFMVDSAAIMAAVLLFGVIATAMMKSLPNWATCTFIALLTTAILTLVYWIVFSSWTGATPGAFLAEKVFGEGGRRRMRGDERVRFR